MEPLPHVHDDPIGYETLRRMASVAHYNQWIYDELAPFAGQRVLEVGCGIGNMTEYFQDREVLVGIDRLPASVTITSQRFRHVDHVHILQGDITDPQLVPRLRPYGFDTVICINVLEHIQDDVTALMHMREVLQPGGRVLLLVPAGRYMYGTLDEALGHYRRYEAADLAQRLAQAELHPLKLQYMNLAGIPGWYLNSRILRRTLLPKGQLQWFNRLAPWFIRFERWLRRHWDVPYGQSLVCVAARDA